MLKGAVFLDRDGTVNVEKGYLDDPDELELYDGVPEAIGVLNRRCIPVVLVTNQSGVARRYFPEERVVEINERLREMLKDCGATLSGIYYCPHHPDFGKECDCRKPKPGLLKKASEDLGIDLSSSYVVGDQQSDLELAHRVGAKAVLVLTGYGKETQKNLEQTPHFIAERLTDAVEWIIKDIE